MADPQPEVDATFSKWLRSEVELCRLRTVDLELLKREYAERAVHFIVGETPVKVTEIHAKIRELSSSISMRILQTALDGMVKRGDLFRLPDPLGRKDRESRLYVNTCNLPREDPGLFHGRLEQVWSALILAGSTGITVREIATKLRVRDLDIRDELIRLELLGFVLIENEARGFRCFCKDPKAVLPRTEAAPNLDQYKEAVLAVVRAAGSVGASLQDILSVFGGVYKIEQIRKHLRRCYLRQGILLVQGRRSEGRYYLPGTPQERVGLQQQVLDVLRTYPKGLSYKVLQEHMVCSHSVLITLQRKKLVVRRGCPMKSVYLLTRKGKTEILG